MSHHPVTFYRERLEEYEQRLAVDQTRSGWISRIRITMVVVGLFLCIQTWHSETIWSLPGILTIAGAISFIALAGWHEWLCQQIQSLRMLVAINRRQIARAERDWEHVIIRDCQVDAKHRVLANDLDVIGHASLLKLVDNTATPLGQSTLIRWLTEPVEPDVIRQRQQSVRALANHQDQMEDWYCVSRFVGEAAAGPESLCKWVEGSCWLQSRAVLNYLCLLSPIAMLASIALAFFGAVPVVVATWTVLALAFVQFGVSVIFTGSVQDQFGQIGRTQHEVRQFNRLIQLALELPDDTELIASRQSQLNRSGRSAAAEINYLTWILSFAHLRKNPVLGAFHILLQLILLWDFQVLRWLEHWQRKNRSHVRGWFEAIADVEVLSSFATLHHDHPNWTFPQVVSDADTLHAEELGHPLLKPSDCVRNDVSVGPAGTCLLVTGSNMSGKSTLLRSLGLNILLAQAGAPVCAMSMKMPPCLVATSMRVHDSLADGVSFYMAELIRLKQIVDDARRIESEPLRLFYLLDEILQGTNSAERHIAVARVVAHLIEHGAIGAISTHDLELASHPKLAAACRPVYFREQLVADGRRMIFDYQMREGVAPTTNALVLLEMVGLNDET